MRSTVALASIYKFEKLEVYQMALTYTDMIYALVEKLPRVEEGNLKSQIIRAATSIVVFDPGLLGLPSSVIGPLGLANLIP